MLLARRAGPANCNAASLHCCFRTERKKHKVKSLVFKGCDRSKYCFLKNMDQVKSVTSECFERVEVDRFLKHYLQWTKLCCWASMPMQHFQLLRIANAHTCFKARSQQVLVTRYQEPQGSLVPVVGVWFGKLYLIRLETQKKQPLTAAMVVARKRILLSWNVSSHSLLRLLCLWTVTTGDNSMQVRTEAFHLGWLHYLSQLSSWSASKSHTWHPEAGSYQSAFMLVVTCSLMLRCSCWHGSDSQLL